ncbi:MAG: hypothetical protein ACI398_00370 [Clostridium sp.]
MLISKFNYNNIIKTNNVYNNINKSIKCDTINKNDTTKNSKKSQLEETVIAMAKKDAADGVYMGDEFMELRKAYVSEVSPDRNAAIAEVTARASENASFDLDCDLDKWIAMLLGLPYKAECTYSASGLNTAGIFDENGELIATYNWQSGWTSVSTSAENERHDELKSIYYNAYHEARQSLKEGQTGSLINIQG